MNDRSDTETGATALVFPIPFYYDLWNRRVIAGRLKLGILISVVAVASSLPLNLIFDVDRYVTFNWAYALLRAFILSFGLWSLQYTYRETIQVSRHALSHLTEDRRQALRRSIGFLYGNRLLAVAGGSFAFLLAYQWSQLGIRTPLIATVYISTSALITGFVAGLGLHTALFSLYLAPQLLPDKMDRYFALAPVRSTTVREVSQLFVKYSTVFAFEVLPFAVGFWLFLTAAPSMVHANVLKLDLVALRTSSLIVAFLFIVFMPAYFVLPQIMIAWEVKKVKLQLQRSYQEGIGDLIAGVTGSLDEVADKKFQLLRDTEQQVTASKVFPLGIEDLAKPFVPFVTAVASLFGNDMKVLLMQGWKSLENSLLK